MSKNKLPIYLGDSSDDEIIENIVNDDSIFIFSALLGKKSLKILTHSSVEGFYIKIKNKLHQEIFNQENKKLLNAISDKYVLGKYLSQNVNSNQAAKVKLWDYLSKYVKQQNIKTEILSFLKEELEILRYRSEYIEKLTKVMGVDYSNIKSVSITIGLNITTEDVDNKLKELFETLFIQPQTQIVNQGQQKITHYLKKAPGNQKQILNTMLSIYTKKENTEELLSYIANEQTLKLSQTFNTQTIQEKINETIQTLCKTKLVKEYKRNPRLFYKHLKENKLEELSSRNLLAQKKLKQDGQQQEIEQNIQIDNEEELNQDHLQGIFSWYENSDEILSAARIKFISNYFSFTKQLDFQNSTLKEYVINCLEYINSQNQSISTKLWRSKPEYSFYSDPTKYLANFRLYHRIVKAKLKTNGILKIEDKKTRETKFCNEDFTTSEELTIYSSGTRGDIRNLPGTLPDSYVGITKYLQDCIIHKKFTSQQLILSLKRIIKGEKITDLDLENSEYLHRLADLLFNCEPERNISAFLTNAMFFDLVFSNKYHIKELPNRLPMAMKGAIEASRFIWNILAGEYGDKGLRQHFDYKVVDKEDLSTNMKCFELTLKEMVLLNDWLQFKQNQMSSNLDKNNVMQIIVSINSFFASEKLDQNINDQLIQDLSKLGIDIQTSYYQMQENIDHKDILKNFKNLINSTKVEIQQKIIDCFTEYSNQMHIYLNESSEKNIDELIKDWYRLDASTDRPELGQNQDNFALNYQ